MKKQQLFTATVLFSLAFILHGCEKSEVCRTCTAKHVYDNTIVKTEKACNEKEEADFKFKYNSYPTVATCE